MSRMSQLDLEAIFLSLLSKGCLVKEIQRLLHHFINVDLMYQRIESFWWINFLKYVIFNII